jgi:hypothetical protein
VFRSLSPANLSYQETNESEITQLACIDPLGSVDRSVLTSSQPFSMKKEFLTEDREELLNTLKARFQKNISRHKGLEWAGVQAKMEVKTEKLWSLK